MRLLALLTVVPTFVCAQMQPSVIRIGPIPDSLSHIMAGGQTTIRLTPNRATIFIVIDAAAPTSTEALARSTGATKSVQDTLLKSGIPAADVTIIPYGIAPTPTTSYGGGQGNPATAFTGRTVIRLVTPISRLPELTVAALARGASNISPPQFWSTELEEAHHDAIAKATASAQAHAEQIASMMGRKLGSMIDLNAPTYYPQENMGTPYLPGNNGYDSQPKPVPEIRLTISVTGRWTATAK